MTDTTYNATREKLGVGEIIGDTFSIFFRRFFHIIGLSLLPAIAAFLLILLAATPLALTGPSDIAGIAIIVLLGAVMICAYFFITALVVRLAYDVKAGNRMRLGNYLSSAFQVIVPLIICSLISSFLIMVGAVLFILPGLYLMALWIGITPAIMVEKAGFGSFRRSADLTRGYRWACVGAILLMMLCNLIISFGLALVAAVIGAIAGQTIEGFIGLFTNSAALGFPAVFTALIYARLREIKDGTSVEQLAKVFA